MHPSTPWATTLSTSTSSKTMLADLPPSSCETRLMDSAAVRATRPPTLVEPVNDTMSTSGWPASDSPSEGPAPFTRLKTPGGTPASSTASAKRIAESGAISLGFRTMVQPAASAGATLAVTWFMGQFHGANSAHTPTGSRTILVEPQSCSSG